VRIGIVAPPWLPVPPPGYGGTESVLDGLARGLQYAGHEVVLCATGDSRCPVPTSWVLERASGVETAHSATELRHVIHAYERLAGDVDVVHDHTLVGPIFARRFANLRVVTTNHGPFEGELGDYYRAITGEVPIIAISHHQASTAQGTLISSVIHHGVDVEQLPPGDGRGDYALFLGRMSPDKGVDAAIRIARAAGVRLIIAARMTEASELAYFAERVAPLLGPDVDFVGEVGGATKVALLGEARCLLNPLAWPEPFGMVMVEALACGTPVVATPSGSVPEIVEHGATGFVCLSESDLVKAVQWSGELDRRVCRSVAVKRFSLSRMVGDHLNFYQAVTETTRRPEFAA
jgi:glycosyltransferase involved in cell wall biosynthesis